ncbi:TRM11 family SAM-dependent methyltransferase [Ectobacillus polymachus]|uniref:TRM11 family SAM-dependent methyltransferase n=1 Tax=Ectobacillus polymachus TaxID=1508806 RepID=UPI003A83AA5C
MERKRQKPAYLYTFACREEELSLCQMEMRAFFGRDTASYILKSEIEIDPSRSPFMKERIQVMFEGDELFDIINQVGQVELKGATFKIIFVKINDLGEEQKIEYNERRNIERKIGANMNGEADVHHPERVFGIVPFEGRWYFGPYVQAESVWFQHVKKPRMYSTALSTRVARAVANIAVPKPEGVKAIDPCCGIGTVLVEARSMGIDMDGRDINPLVTSGTRENLAYFGLTANVTLGPIAEVTKDYDVAILDMPYNLFTHATYEDQFAILQHARRFTKKVIVIMIEVADEMIEKAGFTITDRCVAKKGTFSRQICVCE